VPDEVGIAEQSAAGSQRSPASPIIIETLGELLKYVVNSRLPIEWRKQNITSLSRAVGIRLAAAEMVECGIELKGGKLPGFGIIPTE
jgi:hypothetical protein